MEPIRVLLVDDHAYIHKGTNYCYEALTAPYSMV